MEPPKERNTWLFEAGTDQKILRPGSRELQTKNRFRDPIHTRFTREFHSRKLETSHPWLGQRLCVDVGSMEQAANKLRGIKTFGQPIFGQPKENTWRSCWSAYVCSLVRHTRPARDD